MIKQESIFLGLLVVQFWLSGLFVLSVMFLEIEDINQLTLFTFIGYSIGSFSAGILSDIIGRRPLFIICSIFLFVSSTLLFWDLTVGLILANICIGPINNLTFVFINENYQKTSELNTVKVLVGWSISQITLGVFFLIVDDSIIFLYFLSSITLLYAIGVVLYTKQTDKFVSNKQQFRKRSIKQILIPNEIKAIIGGSILMFMMQMFYYRTQFTLDRFGISLEINTIIVGVAETCANIGFFTAIKQCRRKIMLLLLILALMVFLFVLTITNLTILQTVVEGVMRLCDTSIMLVLGVYLPQLFQVKDKCKGTNYIMCFGVLGSALSGKIFTKLPFGYLQIFLLAAISSLCLLPETKILSQAKDNKLIDENSNILSIQN